MPTSFFSLPREIRDIIYELLLVSPTGQIIPLPIAPTKKPTRFKLYTALEDVVSTTEAIPPPLPPLSPPPQKLAWRDRMKQKEKNKILRDNEALSLSIARVNRQIYAETKEMFWERNMFYFNAPSQLNSTLKGMSQLSSRLVRNITLSLSLSTSTATLPRALRLLASRARHGAFASLTLVISRSEFIALQASKMSPDTVKVGLYDTFLNALRSGAGGKFERSMKVESLMRAWRIEGGLDHDTVRDLHLCWGGRMEVNGEEEWVDFVHVGKCAGLS